MICIKRFQITGSCLLRLVYSTLFFGSIWEDKCLLSLVGCQCPAQELDLSFIQNHLGLTCHSQNRYLAADSWQARIVIDSLTVPSHQATGLIVPHSQGKDCSRLGPETPFRVLF
ncbi:uncharacterized protein LOC143036100 [Oratosquilla oratoria]|uniref:uncharacterized protein LOC143036100 n=1 Tax=Oratosquilla oratoria TaxID=337810 RepID=UPI003F76DE8B